MPSSLLSAAILSASVNASAAVHMLVYMAMVAAVFLERVVVLLASEDTLPITALV